MVRESRNVALEARLRAGGMTAGELAEEMNKRLLALTGRRGEMDDRAVRRYLSGRIRWPRARQRLAMESVFDCPAEELGFQRPAQPGPGAPASRHDPEDPVLRRSFLSAATATAASMATPAAAAPQIGASDLARLRARLDALSSRDDREGGGPQMETAALYEAQRALDLMQRSRVSARIRAEIYSVASDATAAAAWAALDSHELERAQSHLDRALTLAGLSSDPVASLRAWNNIAMLAGQRKHWADAEAAARAARAASITRRDPLYSSLCHARGALAQASMQDERAALRSLGHAEDALAKAEPGDRPGWTHFYDEAELHGLSAIVHLRLGRPDQAEYHAHNTLARLKPGLQRNRSYYTAQLALAQVRQGELELACGTADQLLAGQLPGSARVRELLRTFRTEAAATGSARARAWLDETRSVRI